MATSRFTWLVACLGCAVFALEASAQQTRPVVGVALGGGSARGFAHVGVLRWFEDHHVPIDVVAGTSMGGLIGGAYASGMSSSELAALLRTTDWDEVFSASAYRYKSIRRKDDARAYPSRLELQVRRGVTLPSSLNNGQQVDFMLARIGALYAGLPSFDALPTPFRCVAVDLRTATAVVLDSGSLPVAMRATMSLPGIFPPIELRGRVLVDGGALDNVPADVVRAMGADVVIAVDVGSSSDTSDVRFSAFGLLSNTMRAMIRANTRRALTSATFVIEPNLESFSGGDWRRAAELAVVGYRAAESMSADLLPLAVDDATWRRYLADRAAKRRARMPAIARVEVRGATPTDARTIHKKLEWQLREPLNPDRIENDLLVLGGLDRYVSIGWDLSATNGTNVLVIKAITDRRSPPILLSAINVQNRTSDAFTFQFANRLLSYDTPFSGAEVRLDLALGTNSSIAAELRRPIGHTSFFAAVALGAAMTRVDFITSDVIVAQYGEQRAMGEVDAGVELSRDAEIRGGVRFGYYDAHVLVGDPGLPSVRGFESEFLMRGVYDTHNNAVAPSEGTRVVGAARYVTAAPDPDVAVPIPRTNDALAQGELDVTHAWSWKNRAHRLLVLAAGGTSFGNHPLPGSQFVLGLPWKLDAFSVGQRRGDNYAVLTTGYLRAVARLPEFLGGPLLIGGWLENGSAFDELSDAALATQVGVGAIAETLIGPAIVGYSIGSGVRRFYMGFGRLFR